MKCPNDKTEMIKGSLSAQAMEIYWDENEATSDEAITAYKCPECGKVELVVKVTEEEKGEE